tara:strand:+ start:471 stop:620 length:150 start_codon:yes stop_codon:yes gene_type:complete
MKLDPVKTVKCKECGEDVVVNAAYPITEVGCRDWYCPKKSQKFPKPLSY